MSGETDAQLVARSLEGNENAFRTLVERHQAVVYGVVRAVLGAGDEVEDVAQDVFIKVYRGLGTYRGDARFATWLYRIARNEAINAARRRRVDTTPVDDVVLRAPEGERPDEQYHRDEQRRTMETHLAQLDEHHRVVLELRYMSEKSYAEIAEILELPIGTVKTYIHRAKQELKRHLMRLTVSNDRRAKKRHEM